MPTKEVEATAPYGANDAPIQVLAPEESTVAEVDISAVNDRAALPANASIVEVAVTANCRFAFGNSTVDASVGTRRILTTGVYVYRVPQGATNFAAIRVATESGLVTVGRLW